VILKTTLNVRISSGMNLSQSYEHIVDGMDEAGSAASAGYVDAQTFSAYIDGFKQAMDEAETS
jgi:hypothetical protein